MTTWIDFFVYAALAVTLWAGIPAWSRFTIPMVADRNPEWLLSHPEAEKWLADNRWFRRSCQIWGELSIAALLAVQAGAWPSSLRGDGPGWEALKDLNSALIIGGLLYVFICMLLFERWVRANIPLAARREATLVRRSVDDSVPRPVQLAVYGLVVLHLAVWLAVGVTGRSSAAGFWGMLAFQCAVSGLLLWVVRIAVRRKPNAMDRIFGPGYRITEVRVAFACQLVPLMNGAERLYEQTGGATPESLDRVLHLGLVTFVATLAAATTMWARQPGDGGRSASSSGALRSLPSL